MSFFNQEIHPPQQSQQQKQQQQQQQDPTFFPETILEGNIDSDFVIYGFANSFSVPQWIPDKKQKTCYHCKDALKSNCTHNCRLCGNVFCSHCTGKYNLPEKYEQKQKKHGPTRVCYGCKMSCIRMRQAALNLPLDSIQRMLPPPIWQDMKSYIACNKCCVKRRNPHNCRLCGNLHCDDCTTKMALNLPPAFNIKKKIGPQRVCDGCRYRIMAGARLDDGTQQHIQSFLLRQQSQLSQQQQSNGNLTPNTNSPSLNNNGVPIEPLILTNPTSPRNMHMNSSANTPSSSQNIRIVHGTNVQIIPSIPMTPLNLPIQSQQSQQSQRTSVSSGGPINLSDHQVQDMNQITSSLNSLSIDSQSADGTTTPREGTNNTNGLNNVRYQYVQTPQNQVSTPTTRTQRYQAAINAYYTNPNATNANISTSTNTSTNQITNPSSSSNTTANVTTITNQPHQQLPISSAATSSSSSSTVFNNGPSSSSSSSSQTPQYQPLPLPPLQPTGEQLQNIIGKNNNTTNTNNNGEVKKRPPGGRDMYRALSTNLPQPQLHQQQPQQQKLRQQQQTLDDQKEADMDNDHDFIPPPPPLTDVPTQVDYQRLVKPSELFNRLKKSNNNDKTTPNNNNNNPGYLQDENMIQPGR